MRKQELRSVYLQKRIALSDEAYAERSNKIATLFFENINLTNIKVVHVFLPMIKSKEPNTWAIIERMKKEFPSIRFSIPRVNNKTQVLENFYFDSPDQLKENTWGIQEPQVGEPTNAKDIDLVLVPLLAVDKNGHRVGYGKGYYDKFLSLCKPTCLKIGLSLFDPIDKIEDVNEQDVALQSCVTPDQYVRF